MRWVLVIVHDVIHFSEHPPLTQVLEAAPVLKVLNCGPVLPIPATLDATHNSRVI